MTAGGGSAQTLDLPPGKALSMGTIKLMLCHRRMGMRCGLGPPFFCFNGKREPFMLVGGLNRRFGSRKCGVSGPMAIRHITEPFDHACAVEGKGCPVERQRLRAAAAADGDGIDRGAGARRHHDCIGCLLYTSAAPRAPKLAPRVPRSLGCLHHASRFTTQPVCPLAKTQYRKRTSTFEPCTAVWHPEDQHAPIRR